MSQISVRLKIVKWMQPQYNYYVFFSGTLISWSQMPRSWSPTSWSRNKTLRVNVTPSWCSYTPTRWDDMQFTWFSRRDGVLTNISSLITHYKCTNIISNFIALFHIIYEICKIFFWVGKYWCQSGEMEISPTCSYHWQHSIAWEKIVCSSSPKLTLIVSEYCIC